MDDNVHGYDQLIQKFVEWAQSEADLRAAMIIGSRSRVDHPADEWADLDIVLFLNTPQCYIDSAEWLDNIDPPWLTFIECTPDGGWERRALFAPGLDVDFAIVPAQYLESMLNTARPPMWVDIFRRGSRIVLDKDGFIAQLMQKPTPDTLLFQPPAEVEYLNVVNDFWYHTVWTAKHLRRGELWWAKSGCDDRLKSLLRQVLEWHAHTMKGSGYDTWMRGRFLEEWADPRALKELPTIFAHYDPQDIAQATFRTMDLFRWLSIEVAQHWGYTYPTHGEQAASGLVEQILKGID
jgi:aminoglycoside 6-adenylyltransferase